MILLRPDATRGAVKLPVEVPGTTHGIFIRGTFILCIQQHWDNKATRQQQSFTVVLRVVDDHHPLLTTQINWHHQLCRRRPSSRRFQNGVTLILPVTSANRKWCGWFLQLQLAALLNAPCVPVFTVGERWFTSRWTSSVDWLPDWLLAKICCFALPSICTHSLCLVREESLAPRRTPHPHPPCCSKTTMIRGWKSFRFFFWSRSHWICSVKTRTGSKDLAGVELPLIRVSRERHSTGSR